MNLKHFSCSLTLTLCALPVLASPVTDSLIAQYSGQTGISADPERGRSFWFADNGGKSCTSCHGNDVEAAGKHAKTGKTIEPMAPSVNTTRLTDERKIEKWFLRNCKWTLNRECTAVEKADILVWLSAQ